MVSSPGSLPPAPQGFDFNKGAVAGGIHAGAQRQWGQWVLGGEATWTGIRKTITSPYFPDTDTETAKIANYATVVGRVGYALDRVLIYAKAGYAGRSHASAIAVAMKWVFQPSNPKAGSPFAAPDQLFIGICGGCRRGRASRMTRPTSCAGAPEDWPE